MATCSNCGHQLEDDALVCPQCGTPTPLSEVKTEGTNRVPLMVGLVVGALAVSLSLFSMLRNSTLSFSLLTLQSLALVIFVAGGFWGLIAWAIAAAFCEAGPDNSSVQE